MSQVASISQQSFSKALVPTPRRVLTDPIGITKRQQQSAFVQLVEFIEQLPQSNLLKKIQAFHEQASFDGLPDAIKQALKVAHSRKSGLPSQATIYRWMKEFDRFKNGSPEAGAKQYTGRVRKNYGWEAKAIELYQKPSKPGYAVVAYWLRTDYGFESATASRVKTYLQKLPETLGKQSPGRVGKHYYRLNMTPHKIRDNTVLPVGFAYEGDGHRCDVYVAHPETGSAIRVELTVWIDVRSAFVVGWYESADESAVSTLYALSHAIMLHNHVPAMLFVDNGCGFRSKMMDGDTDGFYQRMSITTNYSLPGNPKSKGLVEGWFGLFRDRHDKKFDTYCGKDMAEEINRRLSIEVNDGKRQLPTKADYLASVARYIHDYNHEPKGSLGGKSPIEVWQDLERVEPHIPADAIVMPRKVRTVRKYRIQLDNRFYQHAYLAQYKGQEVIVEYSMHDDRTVRVLDEEERLICVAELVSKIARLPQSRIDEAAQKRLDGQIKRLDRKKAELEAQARPAISADAQASTLLDITDFQLADDTDFNPEDALFLGVDDERDEVSDGNDIEDLF